MTKRPGTTTALTHWFTWRHVRCKLIEKPHQFGGADTLLELHVIAPRDTPVPITSTGFVAHFTATAAIDNAGGPVAFMTAWMDREAKTKAYKQSEFRWRQGDLFDTLVPDEDREA